MISNLTWNYMKHISKSTDPCAWWKSGWWGWGSSLVRYDTIQYNAILQRAQPRHWHIIIKIFKSHSKPPTSPSSTSAHIWLRRYWMTLKNEKRYWKYQHMLLTILTEIYVLVPIVALFEKSYNILKSLFSRNPFWISMDNLFVFQSKSFKTIKLNKI